MWQAVGERIEPRLGALWATIGARYILLSLKHGIVGLIFFLSGHVMADLLVVFARKLPGLGAGRGRISDRVYHGLLYGSAVLVLVFAALFIGNGIMTLMSRVPVPIRLTSGAKSPRQRLRPFRRKEHAYVVGHTDSHNRGDVHRVHHLPVQQAGTLQEPRRERVAPDRRPARPPFRPDTRTSSRRSRATRRTRKRRSRWSRRPARP